MTRTIAARRERVMRHQVMNFIRTAGLIAALLILVILAGCAAVGPDYQVPAQAALPGDMFRLVKAVR